MASTCLCDRCAALCCRYIALPIDNPTDVRDYDNIRWYLLHENVVVFVESGQWYISFLTRCKQLQPDNRCGIYETRPRICRGYDTENCDYHGGEYNYDKLFTSAEQLREFAEKTLGRPLVLQKRPPKRKAVALPLPAPVVAARPASSPRSPVKRRDAASGQSPRPQKPAANRPRPATGVGRPTPTPATNGVHATHGTNGTNGTQVTSTNGRRRVSLPIT